MKSIKSILFGLAALAVIALVVHLPGDISFMHVGAALLGLAALDSLASSFGLSAAVVGSVGSALSQLLKDKPFKRHVLDRWAKFGLSFHHESNEEIEHAIARTGRAPKLHSYNPFTQTAPTQGGIEGRLEENYLYSTRRFPLNSANNTIGAGALVAGDYNFFTSGVGDAGSTMGYASVPQLTYVQTNMAPSGKIPNGRGFKLFDLGVSFNAQASIGDIAQLLDSCSLSFQKQAAQLKVFHGPIILWPGGVGPAGYAATATTVEATTTTIAAATNGAPQLINMRRSKNPRILSANDDFQYVVTAASATPRDNVPIALSAFVEMRVALYGFVLDRIPN